MEPFRFHKLPEPPRAMQTQQNMKYMKACPRHKHGKTGAAGIRAFVAVALQSHGFSDLAETSNLVLKFAFKMNLSRFQKLPESLKVHASTAENESQASLSSPQAPQVWQNVYCRHPPLGRRHRGHEKMWVAGIPALPAGSANAANHVLQACMRVLQASLSSLQAPQTLQITGAGMPVRLGL